jgi:putative flavoprotein involved in K+ transport
MMERVQTVIVGAGQAGLSMSYQLGRRGIEHLVLERGRVAERWRSERWDSLMFQFPNWMLRLPEHSYRGTDPEGFTHRDGIVRFIEDFAARISPPMRCGIRVIGLQCTPSGRLRVETDHYAVEALNVVVATGPYQQPAVPPFSNALPFTVCQITANRYTHAQVLPPGNVLVVGSGGSGWQIAEDLLQSGRQVYLSVGRHRRVPRRYRGKDFGWWQETTGAADQIFEGPAHATLAPLLTGVAGGRDADLRALAPQGATLIGSLGAVRDGRLHVARDLEENLALGDETFAQFMRSVDEYIVSQRLAAPEPPRDQPHNGCRLPTLPVIRELDLTSAGITSVIWAVGYRYDFGWIRCPVLDTNGRPVHQRGVTATPGLYFLGLPRLHKIKSAFLWGVGEDAAYLAEHIANRK